ncbi:hypothetical protein ACJX0J_029408, partial [Zea mays]
RSLLILTFNYQTWTHYTFTIFIIPFNGCCLYIFFMNQMVDRMLFNCHTGYFIDSYILIYACFGTSNFREIIQEFHKVMISYISASL